jgi:hypothetical protein
MLRGQILEQGAPQRHVDHLNAATDAEDGKPALASHGEKRQLKQIPFPARSGQLGRRLRPVPGGIHVLAAGQNEAVDTFERASSDGGSDQGGQNKRYTAGGEEGFDVSTVDTGAVRPVPATNHSTHSDARVSH